jgi:prepilin-type processing-associated H-X9-DG protein
MSQYESQPVTPQRRRSPWAIVLIVLAGCGAVSVVLIAILAAILFPVFAQARESARRVSCMSNQRRIANALLTYAADRGRFPAAATWQQDIAPYLKDGPPVFVCPSRRQVPNGYAYNSVVAGRDPDSIANPSALPLVFESSVGTPNAADRVQSFVTPHRDRGIVAFADGSVRHGPSAPSATAGLGRP